MKFGVFTISTSCHLKDIQDTLNEGVKLYNTHYELGGHLSEISNKDYNDQRKIAQRLLEEHDDRAPLQRVLKISLKDTMRNNFLKLNEKLRDQATWSLMRSTVPGNKKATVDGLWKEWQRQAEYSHFTPDALFQSETIFQELHSLIKLAYKESIKKKYETNKEWNIKSYQQYLVTFEKQIQLEREKIAEALYYRIKVAYANNTLGSYNPTCPLLDKLQAQNIQTYEGMRANDFVNLSLGQFPLAKAYAYILKHGNLPLKYTIAAYFSLDKNNPDFSLKTIQHGTHYFLVPQVLATYVPQTSTFLRWLFPGYRLRYQFFHDKTELLFKLAVLNSDKASVQGILDMQNPAWKNLESLQDSLEEEVNATESKISKWFSFLFETSNTFLKDWKNTLHYQQQLVTRRQIAYLLKMAQAPLPLEYAFQDNDVEKFIDVKQTMNHYLDKLESRVNTQGFSEEDKRRFQNIKRAVIAQWNLGDTKNSFSSVDSVLFHLSQSPASIPMDKFSALETELTLKVDDDLEEIAANRSVLASISSNIQKVLDKLPALFNSDTPIDDELLYLHQASHVLAFLSKTSFKDSQSMEAMKTKLNEFLLTYQASIKNQSKETLQEKNDYFIRLEKAIHSVISINTDWDKERKALFKAEGFRLDIIHGYKPVDVDECLQQSREERLERNKTLEEATARQTKIISEIEEKQTLAREGISRRAKEMKQYDDLLQSLGIFKDSGKTMAISHASPPEITCP